MYYGVWRRRWDFEASPQCGLFSQLGYFLARLSALFPHLHTEMVLATSQGHRQDGQAVCSYGVKAGTSASFNE